MCWCPSLVRGGCDQSHPRLLACMSDSELVLSVWLLAEELLSRHHVRHALRALHALAPSSDQVAPVALSIDQQIKTRLRIAEIYLRFTPHADRARVELTFVVRKL